MVDSFLMSSQGSFSRGSTPDTLHNQENITSSSPQTAAASRKPRKPPTITPKRFTRFFTPRHTGSSRGSNNSRASRRLRDITKEAVNRKGYATPTQRRQYDVLELSVSEDIDISSRPVKRRKYSIDLSSSPPQLPAVRISRPEQSIHIFEDGPPSPMLSEVVSDMDSEAAVAQVLPRPIRRLPNYHGSTKRLLYRSFGGYDAITLGVRGSDHGSGWQSQTANFVSTPSDVHTTEHRCVPFCVANCNTNSLIAVGDESGTVRLLDSSSESSFSTPHVLFRPHKNAVMDLAFSSDDYLLATASGDQTARLIDMHTQQTRSILTGHVSSLKQIKFQPGNDNIVTSSSRDGSVQVWDLRCSTKASGLPTKWSQYVDGGGIRKIPALASQRQLRASEAHRSIDRPVKVGGDPDLAHSLSITATQHLTNGREHILLTASEVDTSIKVWDLRQAHRTRAMPLSSTPLPEIHQGRRRFGINSLALSGDGSRVFAVCRDNMVYAYNTNNLVTGSPSQFETSASETSSIVRKTGAGASPVFALKHDGFRNNSFYIRGALRPARGDKSELMAVGSSDFTPVVFPTDERHFKTRRSRNLQDQDEADDDDDEPSLPTLPSSQQQQTRNAESHSFPVYSVGSALVRGHKKEVSSLCWSYDGHLVSIGDDYRARRWTENAEKARELRQCGDNGEGAATRWGHAWATVDDPYWDEDDG
ncbi:WD40 repeat-like protein [Polychaeton citri CBS 116435]|uniref:WD40 repeat-like protein n=1 Tax=Polychaeton citri CBS 116435 TaxID=1314669 RepID=A0A9P4QF28_9PEZI|nr:WD40 repeat-like protein [Polychaeton citri CBS 116435]